ncbi:MULTISPECIES: heavy metal translocating P-type ATPase [unclassified Bradyrhizobium]|uniref:heavy metal translocating P-type ATPase n=1 Tax=unclassified Bradyrhizobium TaxID=2631580 RepID=UPI001BAAA954|nr:MULTISPECIES: heavy metal translocating P-type ATPase [unclassified Bradyrhizobium]MBR1201263.1 heavy metal translocating P-type ATPase [Bradyrhizobium sp. AUGA SZCCT0124]MBR1316811.1 heavy metal translocating P-type ATPase [Bradyrhizobium sp. AUGA SZCCT0051]MBR1345098.1 heavy metal translocating P-type ATPase [Bradyrhizobium sp. AUGA SZCCT0105]MBR1359821.1 heavy metal translocating P-type ATPase [Bradyrhizobium sp. AUGA SZCCT0045]
MDFSFCHSMPGRIRLSIPALGQNRKLGEICLGWLRVQDGIRTARINYDCASLVLEYDPAHEQRLLALLNGFRSMSLADVKALCASAAQDAGAPRASVPEVSKRSPLALPTLSLFMAFSANPVIAAVNMPLMLWNAIPIAKRAWKVWANESRLNIDVLDTLAITASVLQGNPLAGCIVTWLIKLGDWIRDLTAAGSRRAINELLEFQSKTAWLLRDGEVVSIPAAELQNGDIVVVYPGEMIPVDGEIIDGSATIDQKTITGEGLPVHRGKGEAAFAATVIREGQITLRALRVGTATTAGQIVRLIESAPIGDTRMQNHAERFADRLVTPTLALATGTAMVSGDFNRFLSLVIVDYGTGIRVAAPTSVLSSMTLAARTGMIIKSGGHMEKLAGIDTMVFDKTGTLTHGTPAVIDVISYQNSITPNHLLGLAAAAETKLQHPVAEALRTRARQLAVNIPPCHETTYRLGLGVEGQVNGYYVHVGNQRFMRQSEIAVDASALDRAALDERGYSSLYIAVDGKLAGLVPYSDEIREESRSVIQRLHALGVKNSIMLTGDNAVVARAVCENLGLTEHFADMLPADKADVIQQLQRQGRRVAMVGDGINDSPALSFADVGIAMKHGAEVTHESADVILMEDSLWKLVKAVEISQGAVSLIKQNYAIVAALNTLALGLALPGGLITPEVTALISNGSAILASFNGIRPILRYQ